MPRGLTAAAEPRWRRRPSPRIRRGRRPRWSSGTMTSRATTTTPRRRRRRQRRRQRRRRRRRRCRRRAGPGHATLATPRRLRRQPRPRPRPLRSSRRPSAGARACRRCELRWRPGAQACALGRAPPWVTRMLVRNYCTLPPLTHGLNAADSRRVGPASSVPILHICTAFYTRATSVPLLALQFRSDVFHPVGGRAVLAARPGSGTPWGCTSRATSRLHEASRPHPGAQ